MRIMDQGIAFRGQPGTDQQSACFPHVCVLPQGRWLVAGRLARTKGDTMAQQVALRWSDDQGRTWSPPLLPFAPPPIEGRPGRFRAIGLTALGGANVLATLCWVDASDPSKPFFNTVTEGLLDSHLFWSRSDDAGRTWSPPRRIATGYNQPTPITGPTLLLRDGRWACQFELNKPYDDTSVWKHRACFVFSADQGATWGGTVEAAGDPIHERIFYWDQRPCVLRSGRILDLFWTYDNRAGAYLNIHVNWSDDGGRTWTAPRDTGVPGQAGPAVELPDGRLVMAYVDRTGRPMIKARASRDGGLTWPAETELLLHDREIGSQIRRKNQMQDAWAEMGAYSVGLPHSHALPGGQVLTAYYSGDQADQTDIHWVRYGD